MSCSNPEIVNANGSSKNISLKDVREHSTCQSVWMIIEDKVYDLTKFMDEHPGGAAVLLENAGKEATEEFEAVGHSDDARAMMKDYYIGDLDEDDREAAKQPPKPGTSGTAPEKSGAESSFNACLLVPIGVVLVTTLIAIRYFWRLS